MAKDSERDENHKSQITKSGGLNKIQKTKMLDITRDKPIKIVVRVGVPVRDHPKFNFVGKLLGPKGNSLKRLQEETMCKMAVLGRGSMKDRQKEDELRMNGDPRYSHLDEDLHVEISTFAPPAEAHARIAYALAEVRRFLVPDYYDDIRQEQMWEMQVLGSANNQTMNDNNSSIASNSTTPETDALSETESSKTTIDSGSENEATHQTSGNGVTCINNGGQQQASNYINHTDYSNMNNGNLVLKNHSDQFSIPSTALTKLDIDYQRHLQSSGGQSNATATSAAAAAAAAAALGIGNNNLLTVNGGIIQGIIPTTTATNSILFQNEPDQSMTLLGTPTPTGGRLIHPTNGMTNMKSVNIARKRSLMGLTKSCTNPTKRTVLTLLAKAKNAQSLYRGTRNNIRPTAIDEYGSIQMITSPLILQQSALHIAQPQNGNTTIMNPN